MKNTWRGADDAKRAFCCFVVLFCLLVLSSPVHSQSDAHLPEKNPLYVEPESYDFTQNPPLLERVTSGPHGYFRFINLQFSQEVCRRFKEHIRGVPALNLHGDAHLEQYAITDLGRGLTDFDDSSMGPAFLDLLRFGVSLRLACERLGWLDRADDLFSTFLHGYREALNDPQAQIEEPEVARKIRSDYRSNRKDFLDWDEQQILPIAAYAKKKKKKAMQSYVESMMADNDGLRKRYFRFISAGRLKMGIGSALDIKYLVRIHGPSSDPLDDVVLEVKEVRDISGIDCILRTHRADPFRVLLGQARIAYTPFEHLGYFYHKNRTFWVHSGVENYEEVEINESFDTVEQLEEVAYDVGIQLGHGHTRHIGAPFDAQLRRSQLLLLAKTENQLRRNLVELAEQTIAAWKMFRTALDRTK